MLSKIHKGEEGFALITAIMTSAIVVVMGTTVVQLAVHNSEGSAYDRRNVQAIAAAESGVDYYMSFLTATGGQQFPCSVSKPLVGSPGRFTVTPLFYDSLGVPLDFSCANPNLSQSPSAVLLHSVGCTVTLPAIDPVPSTPLEKECVSTVSAAESSRTMEAYAKLTISTGTTFDNAGAIVSESAVTFTANATIGGSNYSDADVYTNGNITLASNSTLYGKIFAQGALTMGSGAEVKKDVWTKGAISMSAGSSIRGTVTASGPPNANITLANNAHIYNGAKASGSITGGTVDVFRTQSQTNLTPPPTRPYPTFMYVPADWTAAGFTNPGDFASCSAAESYIKNTWTSGNLLVRITVPGSTCTLTFTNGTYTVKGNLAIISQGPVTLNTNARFAPTSGQTYNVFLMAGLSGAAPCNITMNTNSGFGAGLPTLLYTPSGCATNLYSNTALTQGQIVSGTINFHHTAQFQYSRLTVPGTGAGGFKQDVVYKREIVG